MKVVSNAKRIQRPGGLDLRLQGRLRITQRQSLCAALERWFHQV